MDNNIMQFHCDLNAPVRVDKYLTEYLATNLAQLPFSRTKVQELIKHGDVKVNGVIIANNYQLKPNDYVEIDLEWIIEDLNNQNVTDIQPVEIPLDVIYEDEDVMVINKQNNLVVHPALGHWDDTLVNGLLWRNAQLSDVNGNFRPGIVHRLDQQTTGLLIVAKNNEAHQALSNQLKDHSLRREYVAIVHGVIQENEAKIIAPIGRDEHNRIKMAVKSKNSKVATTNLVVIERFKEYTYIKCILETGRTHQIRVHLNYIKHPVLGDWLYGYESDKKLDFGQYLHAQTLSFVHPRTNQRMTLSAPLPEEFEVMLQRLHQGG